MIGKNDRQEQVFHYFRMSELVPENHPLRVIDRHVDFSFVRERVRGLYSHTGRPSVDPEVMARMLLVGYLYGITSERRLCEEVAMHVGYRWFAGLGMDERVPDHSTFSKNRHGRFGSGELWREVFDEVVRMCVEAGLVSGRHLTADGTLVAADASMNSMEPVVVGMTPAEYIDGMDAQAATEGRPPKGGGPKCKDPDGGREGEFRRKGESFSNATHRSATDPDARLARKGGNSATKLSYQVSYVMDNKSRVILDAAVSGRCGRGAEMDLALGSLDTVMWRFRIRPETFGADKGYAAGRFIMETYARGVVPHVPVWDTRGEHDTGIYPIGRFTYCEDGDCFICPQGRTLTHHGRNHKQVIYRAKAKDCSACPVKAECTRDKARSVSFHAHREHIEAAKREMGTRSYRLSQRNRKKIEELFGEAKELMGLRRMKFRGRRFALEQTLLTAAAQNIKRLVKHLERRAPKPAQQAEVSPNRPETAFSAPFFRFTLEFLRVFLKTCEIRLPFISPAR